MKRIPTKRRGFTLIEVISVIVILGIILFITVPSVNNTINGSYLKTYEIDLESIKKAATEYVLKENVETISGIQRRIELSDMIAKDLLDEIIDPQTKEKCDGYATVVENDDNYIVHSYLKCGDNYQSDNYNKTDFVLPIITLLGDNPISIGVGETYKDPGITAIDDVDGDITSKVIVTGNINPNESGTYTLIYNVTDNAGNDAIPIERKINVIDNEAPIITIETMGNTVYAKSRNSIVRVRDNAVLNTSDLKYLWNTSTGVPSEASFSTTFTNNSSVTSPSNATGGYYLWVLAKDKSGNTTIIRSNIFNLDNTKPIITLNGSTSITIDKGSLYTDAGATATDAHSGLNGNVTSTGTVNPNVVGVYTITYSISDKAGNVATAVTRTITVKDILAPVITMNGSNPTNIDAGTSYTDAGATAVDDVDGNVTNKITTTSTVNPNVGGTYTVTYRVVDNGGNVATATRTVNVYVTWYQTRTISQATYYGDYSASSSTYYYCPSGYTSSGSGSSMTCSKTVTTSNIATSTYSCPYPYTTFGSGSNITCSHEFEAPSVPASSTTSCSYGTYVSSVNKCRIYTSERVNGNCPSGWTMSSADNCYQNVGTPTTSYSCSGGQNLVGGDCYYCTSGGTLDGTGCWFTVNKTTTTTYSCPSGYTSSGSGSSMTCYTTQTTSSQPSTSYSCPYGGSLSGSTCYRGYYSCSSGTLSGSSCYGSWTSWSTTKATPSSALEVNTEKRLSSV